MDFNKTLQLMETKPQSGQTLVKIKGTKNADGKDLYETYPWFEKFFPDKKNITGIVWGTSGKSVFEPDSISVQFAIIKDGKVVKASGHRNSFTPNQLSKI